MKKLLSLLLIFCLLVCFVSCAPHAKNNVNDEKDDASSESVTYVTEELNTDNYFLFLEIDVDDNYVGQIQLQGIPFYKYSFNVTVTPLTVFYDEMSFENVIIEYDFGTSDSDTIIVDQYGRGFLNTSHFNMLRIPNRGSVKSISGKVKYIAKQ